MQVGMLYPKHNYFMMKIFPVETASLLIDVIPGVKDHPFHIREVLVPLFHLADLKRTRQYIHTLSSHHLRGEVQDANYRLGKRRKSEQSYKVKEMEVERERKRKRERERVCVNEWCHAKKKP